MLRDTSIYHRPNSITMPIKIVAPPVSSIGYIATITDNSGAMSNCATWHPDFENHWDFEISQWKEYDKATTFNLTITQLARGQIIESEYFPTCLPRLLHVSRMKAEVRLRRDVKDFEFEKDNGWSFFGYYDLDTIARAFNSQLNGPRFNTEAKIVEDRKGCKLQLIGHAVGEYSQITLHYRKDEFIQMKVKQYATNAYFTWNGEKISYGENSFPLPNHIGEIVLHRPTTPAEEPIQISIIPVYPLNLGIMEIPDYGDAFDIPL